ncbi:ubiquitin-conjugating enzyme E2-22 kDa-like [Drosophila montana]|uniref:ubiquitin-conjugating enzyme E2-22 kDa-like n=1 Tax=Drosophila montana TaxID=40370 RepID=UPI00313EE41D
MANMSILRIKRELKEVMRGDDFVQGMIKLEVINDNWTNLRGEIKGPRDTPYEGGRFALEIKVPDTYPFSPPTVRFTTRIWHPNISAASGVICRDILKDNWAAAMTLRTVLLSLQALLSAAQPDDPQDVCIAYQFKAKPDVFQVTAKHWTNVYAGGPHVFPDCDTKVLCLMELGLDEHEARILLSRENWNLDGATERIFP